MTQPDAIVAAPALLSKLADVESALGEILRGKQEAVRLSVVCLLARGHLLIEDVPGVGKTTLAHGLARSVDCGFHRLQCTSDMLPSDVTGVTVYNARSGEFEFKPGPLFTNFLLADEINRTTPKTQSALLEAMNERQITVDGRTYPLAEPFMVLATQNPAEHHGTYPLPESQLDRFLMRLRIGYPDHASERRILRNGQEVHSHEIHPILGAGEILQLQARVGRVTVDESLVGYMLAVVERTRNHESLALGVSPRGAQALYRATQAMALIEGREFALPDDVKRLVVPIFAHRLVMSQRLALTQRSSDAGERVLEEILTRIDVPV
jgi:MoxR-like ATPase